MAWFQLTHRSPASLTFLLPTWPLNVNIGLSVALYGAGHAQFIRKPCRRLGP